MASMLSVFCEANPVRSTILPRQEPLIPSQVHSKYSKSLSKCVSMGTLVSK